MSHDGSAKTIYPGDPGGYTIVTRMDPGRAYLDFWVYEVIGHNLRSGELLYGTPDRKRDDPNEETEFIEDAAVYASGGIGSDGCVNMRFDEQDRCMLHFCGREDAEGLGRLMSRIFDAAEREFGKGCIG